MRRRSAGDDAAVQITNARSSLREEQSERVRRYVFSMSLRTICFVGAILASGWLRWTLVVGAIVLPYIAVVIANAGRRRDPIVAMGPVTPAAHDTLGPSRS